MQRIGLITDTHGMLRPEAIDFLRGCDGIVHAGDVCDPSVLDRLARIAPVFAVRGNNDVGAWAEALPVTRTVDVEEVKLMVIHDVADMRPHAVPSDVTVVVHGHSHKPTIVERDGLTFINPGSAGPRRFRLPVSIGELIVDGGIAVPRFVTLID
jgi:putative phosphoesterase